MSAEVLSYLPLDAVMGRVVVPEGGLTLNGKPEFDLTQAPLGLIAPLETVVISQADLLVANHEMKHGLASNEKFLYMSIIPEGNSLGRTVFAGNIDLENFHIAAAGSLVRDNLGIPVGTSGDEAQLDGAGRESAILRARARINRYSDGIRKNLNKLLAIKQEVHIDEFSMWKARAEFEERLKAEGRYDDFVRAYYKRHQKEEVSMPINKMSFSELINSLERCYVIETLKNGYESITNYHEGREVNSIIRCTICGGINGAHSQEIHRIYELQHRRPFDTVHNDPMRVQEKELVPAGFEFIGDEDQPKSNAGIIFKNPFSEN